MVSVEELKTIADNAGIALCRRAHSFLKKIVPVAYPNRGSTCVQLVKCNKALIQVQQPTQAGYVDGSFGDIPQELPTMD